MTYTEGLVNGMYRADTDNSYDLIYYSLRRTAGEMPGPESDKFRKTVLKVPDRGFPGRQFILDQVFLKNYLQGKKADVFHRPSGYTLPDTNKVFKVLTVHDLRTLTMSDQFWAQNVSQYEKALSKADRVVVVSECTKKDLIDHFHMNEKKIRVAHLGADERYRRSGDAEIASIKRKYGLDKPFFMSVGSVPRKNIDGIIRAFAKCRFNKDYLLVLNCKFEVEKYTQMGRDLGVDRSMVFVQNVSDDDLVALYSACHCFAFPSLYEGFGLPILEAMHCGAPVITANISSCPEVAGDAALLVDPQNIDEIAEAMDQMCRDAQLREAFVRKGYERAKLFSWNKFAQEMKAVYQAANKG